MTDMLKVAGTVIKTDEAGRVRTPVARRESLLNEYERSGLLSLCAGGVFVGGYGC